MIHLTKIRLSFLALAMWVPIPVAIAGTCAESLIVHDQKLKQAGFRDLRTANYSAYERAATSPDLDQSDLMLIDQERARLSLALRVATNSLPAVNPYTDERKRSEYDELERKIWQYVNTKYQSKVTSIDPRNFTIKNLRQLIEWYDTTINADLIAIIGSRVNLEIALKLRKQLIDDKFTSVLFDALTASFTFDHTAGIELIELTFDALTSSPQLKDKAFVLVHFALWTMDRLLKTEELLFYKLLRFMFEHHGSTVSNPAHDAARAIGGIEKKVYYNVRALILSNAIEIALPRLTIDLEDFVKVVVLDQANWPELSKFIWQRLADTASTMDQHQQVSFMHLALLYLDTNVHCSESSTLIEQTLESFSH